MATIPDPACPVCSKPVRSGSLVLFEHGEIFHVACRSRSLELAAMEGVHRAKTAQQRSLHLVEETSRRRARQRGEPLAKAGRCPICRYPATVTDWRPRVDWIAVEECRCNGFFALASVFEGRLPKLNAAERRDLSLRILKFRGMGLEAWCTTIDGTVDGPLLVRTERPDRAK